MPEAGWLTAWLLAFALTQGIEAPIYLWRCVPNRPWVALGASAWTHPLLWFVAVPLWRTYAPDLPGLADPNQAELAFVCVCELAIVAGEGAWLRYWRGNRPWLSSAVANGCSFGVGELIYYFAS